MKKTALLALAFSVAGALAAPALAQPRVVHDHGWSPQIIVHSGHRGYWDEHHHWHNMVLVTHAGHHGYWDHHHQWHDYR